jgi:hypothetical protein
MKGLVKGESSRVRDEYFILSESDHPHADSSDFVGRLQRWLAFHAATQAGRLWFLLPQGFPRHSHNESHPMDHDIISSGHAPKDPYGRMGITAG